VTLPSGTEIRKGELVQAIWGGANLDGEQFPDPLTVGFTRFPNRHIAFASGIHRCLGSHLARLELHVALHQWHRRIPDYTVDPDEVQMMNYGVRTMFHLPITFPTG
jgi:cytochrome P450